MAQPRFEAGASRIKVKSFSAWDKLLGTRSCWFDVVWSGRYSPTFWSNLLPQLSTECSPETLVTTYQTTRFYPTEDYNINLHRTGKARVSRPCINLGMAYFVEFGKVRGWSCGYRNPCPHLFLVVPGKPLRVRLLP
jgi:hypothetical protein